MSDMKRLIEIDKELRRYDELKAPLVKERDKIQTKLRVRKHRAQKNG
jgi:hypothetical protein